MTKTTNRNSNFSANLLKKSMSSWPKRVRSKGNKKKWCLWIGKTNSSKMTLKSSLLDDNTTRKFRKLKTTLTESIGFRDSIRPFYSPFRTPKAAKWALVRKWVIGLSKAAKGKRRTKGRTKRRRYFFRFDNFNWIGSLSILSKWL